MRRSRTSSMVVRDFSQIPGPRMWRRAGRHWMRKVRSILCFNVAGPVTIGAWFVARVVVDDDDDGAGDE